MAKPLFQTYALQRFAHSSAALAALHLGKAQRQLYVFLERHSRKQVEGLENHAYSAAAIARQFYWIQFRKVAVMRKDSA